MKKIRKRGSREGREDIRMKGGTKGYRKRDAGYRRLKKGQGEVRMRSGRDKEDPINCRKVLEGTEGLWKVRARSKKEREAYIV